MKYFEGEEFTAVQARMFGKYKIPQFLKIHHTKLNVLDISVIEVNGFFTIPGEIKISDEQQMLIAKYIKKILQEVPNE